MKIANSIWIKNEFIPEQSFIDVQKNSYLASIQRRDFTDPGTINVINDWIAKNTNNKIKGLLKEINPDVIMYLINAVYFKSQWKYKFDKNKTAKGNFVTASGQTVQVDFMEAKATANVTYNNTANIYELPYGNEKYSMLLLQPAQGKSLQHIINAADTATWGSWMNTLTPTSLTVKLPKFSLSYKKELKPKLSDMGMELAFDRLNADFERISKARPYISSILHAATIDVNEEGSEAAAVTVVETSITSAGQTQVIFDKPFIFAIREIKSGIIVFSGILNDPTIK